MGKKTEKEEGIFAAIAALVVLITAIWGNYLISTVIAVIALLFFAEQSFSGAPLKPDKKRK